MFALFLLLQVDSISVKIEVQASFATCRSYSFLSW